jgi:hypothetical protein
MEERLRLGWSVARRAAVLLYANEEGTSASQYWHPRVVQDDRRLIPIEITGK